MTNGVKEEITGETRKSFVMNENEDRTTQTYGMHLEQCLENYKVQMSVFYKDHISITSIP